MAQEKKGLATVLRFEQTELPTVEQANEPASCPQTGMATVLFAGKELSRPEPPKAGVAAEVGLPGAMIFRRFQTSPEELAGRCPGIDDPHILAAAQAALASLNQEEIDCDKVWPTLGVPEQERFAELSQHLLTLSSSPVFEDAKATVNLLARLVRGNEPEQKRHKFFDRVFRVESYPEQTRAAVLGRLNEVNRCWKTLRCQLPAIGKIGSQAVELEKRLRKTQTDVDVATVTMRWLAGYCCRQENGRDRRNCAAALERRTDSLQVTRVTILQAFQQIEILKRTVSHFAEISSEALVNLIPAWCGSCAAILSRDQSARPSSRVTETPEIGQLRSRILSVLGKAGTANGAV